MSLEFNFKNIIDMKKSDNNLLSTPLISDDMLYKFNPERYQFYLKFVEGLSDTETLKKIYYKNTEIKYNREKQNKIIQNIINGLKKLYIGANEDTIKDLNLSLSNRIKGILKNRIENDQSSSDIIEDTFKIKGGAVGDDKQPQISEYLKMPVINKPLDEFNDSVNKVFDNKPTVDNDQLNKLKNILYNADNDILLPSNKLEITLTDRIIFIAITYVIRLITLTLIEWSLNANIINSFFYSFIYYCIIYIVFFTFIILLVNVIYYYPIFQLYTDSSVVFIPNVLYYFYIYSNGYLRLLLHLILISLLMIIPFIIKNDDLIEDNSNITYNYTKKKYINNTLSYFSFFIWILTSIIALKF